MTTTGRPHALEAARRPVGASSIEEILEAARRRLTRLEVAQAHQWQQSGALIVDIRPRDQRAIAQVIPGSVPIERNHLEWRFDPASEARLPVAAYDLDVVVVCTEGYTSSLAAAALQDLGIARATDLVGGVSAWRSAGLPLIDIDDNVPAVDPRLTVSGVFT